MDRKPNRRKQKDGEGLDAKFKMRDVVFLLVVWAKEMLKNSKGFDQASMKSN